MNVQPVNVGHELRIRIESRFRLAPVVIGRPVARQLLHLRERYALRLIGDGFLLRPLRGQDAAPQLRECRVRRGEVERSDGRVRGSGPRLGREGHGGLLARCLRQPWSRWAEANAQSVHAELEREGKTRNHEGCHGALLSNGVLMAHIQSSGIATQNAIKVEQSLLDDGVTDTLV